MTRTTLFNASPMLMERHSGSVLWDAFLALFRQSVDLYNIQDCLLLGGGSQDVFALNQWAIMGLGLRQRITLTGSQLRIERLLTDASQQPQVDTINLSDFSHAQATRHLFDALEQVRQSTRTWEHVPNANKLPMRGGLAGALGYDFYPWCDSGWQQLECGKSTPEGQQPSLLLYEFQDWLLLNLHDGELTVLSDDLQRTLAYRSLWDSSLKSFDNHQAQENASNPMESERFTDDERATYRQNFEASFTPENFELAVNTLKSAIQRGELYQANLSMRLDKLVTLQPLDLFTALSRHNPSPFSGYLAWEGGAIVSNSPERLLQVNADGLARTRPIAGTRGRGQTEAEEARIAETLLTNEKELAEHRMLVDLARNDLGRVCEAGSVHVDDLLVLERYSHVTHLVSNVEGRLQGSAVHEAQPWEALRALFPGGTITGCPKVRCVDLLRQVEPVSRGFYTGALGYIDARSPAMDWNILIRSVFLTVTQESELQAQAYASQASLTYNAAIHVGAGIVQDAVPQHEYRECLRKAAASLDALARTERQNA